MVGWRRPRRELHFALKENNAAIAGMPVKAARPAQHEAHMRAIASKDPGSISSATRPANTPIWSTLMWSTRSRLGQPASTTSGTRAIGDTPRPAVRHKEMR